AAAISPSMSGFSVPSKLSSAAVRKALYRKNPPTASASMVQTAAAAISRPASEFIRRSALSRNGFAAKGRVFKAVTQTAHRLDQPCIQFFAQPADEHLDGVGVAVEILIVKMFHQFGA